MFMKIAHHNKIRMKFEKKYEDIFEDEDLEHMTLERCYEKDNKLYKKSNLKECQVAKIPQKDDFGLYEYVYQKYDYCEDSYYGTIYTKTPFKNMWLERNFYC